MKKFHVSMLLVLLCTVPVFASDDEGGSTLKTEFKKDLKKTVGDLKKTVGDLQETVGDQDKRLAELERIVDQNSSIPTISAYLSSLVDKGCGAITSKSAQTFAKEGAFDAVAYAVASNINLANRIALVDRCTQVVFADQHQANIALWSAFVQGLSSLKKMKPIEEGFQKKMLERVVAFFKGSGMDLVENAVVAQAKSAWVKRVIKPVALRYGIELPAHKGLNTFVDAASWIVFRRTAEMVAAKVMGSSDTEVINCSGKQAIKRTGRTWY